MNTNKREARNSIQLDSIEIILRSMIGEGGQGTIFSARNVADDSSIVAKLVDTSTILKKINFRAEKEAVELIKPQKLEYLCDMYEYCEKDNFGYVLMKRYNCDLFDFAVEKRGIPEELGKVLFKKMVIGLMNLHSVGVAHMDIKPENIMIDIESVSPFIGDFGSCYVFKDDKTCYVKRGTKQYYPPEYASNHSFDPRKVDIYCLGVTLHAMLTGYFPYNSAEPMDQRTIHCSDKLSPQCCDLIFKMLKDKPKKRISLKDVLTHPWLSTSNTNTQRNNYKSKISRKAKDILHLPSKIMC